MCTGTAHQPAGLQSRDACLFTIPNTSRVRAARHLLAHREFDRSVSGTQITPSDVCGPSVLPQVIKTIRLTFAGRRLPRSSSQWGTGATGLARATRATCRCTTSRRSSVLKTSLAFLGVLNRTFRRIGGKATHRTTTLPTAQSSTGNGQSRSSRLTLRVVARPYFSTCRGKTFEPLSQSVVVENLYSELLNDVGPRAIPSSTVVARQ